MIVVIIIAIVVCCCSCCIFCISGGGAAYFGLNSGADEEVTTKAEKTKKTVTTAAAVPVPVTGKPLASYPATCADAKTDPYFNWLKGNVTSWNDGDRNAAITIVLKLYPGSITNGYSNAQVLGYLNKCFYPANCEDAKTNVYYNWLKSNVTSWSDEDRNAAISQVNNLNLGPITNGLSNAQVLTYLIKC